MERDTHTSVVFVRVCVLSHDSSVICTGQKKKKKKKNLIIQIIIYQKRISFGVGSQLVFFVERTLSPHLAPIAFQLIVHFIHTQGRIRFDLLPQGACSSQETFYGLAAINHKSSVTSRDYIKTYQSLFFFSSESTDSFVSKCSQRRSSYSSLTLNTLAFKVLLRISERFSLRWDQFGFYHQHQRVSTGF